MAYGINGWMGELKTFGSLCPVVCTSVPMHVVPKILNSPIHAHTFLNPIRYVQHGRVIILLHYVMLVNVLLSTAFYLSIML